ncbi:MAG: glycosyl transferase [Micromonosporaceae bacterium]
MSSVVDSRTSPGEGPAGPQPGHPGGAGRTPHLIYLAIGFPPAAKSCAYRMRETANQFIARGWDVTAVTIVDEAWEREYGLDHTIAAGVDPRVKVVKLPLIREDLETDIREYTELRSLNPPGWMATLRAKQERVFPEAVFGAWKGALEKALLKIHRSHPADLLVTSCAPYVNLAATWRLWEQARVPYVIDFRDGWSIDVIGGTEAFTRASLAGRWEDKVLHQAVGIWCVNDPIAGWYRERYPRLADRVRVVRNGFDEESLPEVAVRDGAPDGLTFGYLGSINFSPVLMEAVLSGWSLARQQDDLIGRSRFEVRGHIGAGPQRENNRHTSLLNAAADDGVSFGGPVPKAELAETYGRWDALVLMLVGGKFVTSGKVYEFMATGLPVVSAHDLEHDASNVLEGHPLWTGSVGLDPGRLAESFVKAGQLALTATPEIRAEARAMAHQFARGPQVSRVVDELDELVRRSPVAGAAGR